MDHPRFARHVAGFALGQQSLRSCKGFPPFAPKGLRLLPEPVTQRQSGLTEDQRAVKGGAPRRGPEERGEPGGGALDGPERSEAGR